MSGNHNMYCSGNQPDIVQRLRGENPELDGAPEAFMNEAADEIEKLRDRLHEVSLDWQVSHQELSALKAKIEALQPVAFIQKTTIEQFGEWVEVFDLNVSGNGTPLYDLGDLK